MFPENITSILALGKDPECISLKSAFGIAEMGFNVWFITPNSFQQVPENIISPDKETLKLITFLYLNNHEELLAHINNIHTWHKIPNCIIINNFEHYCKSNISVFNVNVAALLISSLLDGVTVCANKYLKKALLFAICNSSLNDSNSDHLQSLINLYFKQVFVLEDCNDINHIISSLSNGS